MCHYNYLESDWGGGGSFHSPVNFFVMHIITVAMGESR